ncbi:hypothetical protein K440DRAFT_617693 [Wilcoxina mikolae CBS 423.85]|nr:hypothetical protein K440DRAFT_617693 [Wilcoxina mikolae CBS 423.85]
MATQTFITGALATETDPAKLRTEPAVQSFAFEYITIIADHLSTDTHLAPSVKSSLSKDFYGWLSAEATATFGSASPTGSASEEPTDTGKESSSEGEPTPSESGAGSTGAAATTTTTKPVDTNTIAAATTTTKPVSALPSGNVGSAKMDMLSLSGVVAGLVAAVAIAL